MPVFDPAILDTPDAQKSLFIITAAFFYERDIATLLEARGFVHGVSFLPYSALKPRDYAIEVSGLCNLRCIACPRSSRPPEGRNACMMPMETFTRIIAKIRREDPFVSNLQLYQWGEPILNKSLPDMIHRARNQGFLASVSSNLNHTADFQALIAARPECLRISVSGTGADYAITHTGGNWHRFEQNLRHVCQLRQSLYPDMKLELYYHLYRHSLGAAQEQIAEFCRQHNVEFRPVPAYIISLDDVLAYCEGVDLPEPAQRARKLLMMDIDEGLRIARSEAHLACESFRVVMINADVSVSVCMMFYDPQNNTIAENFLETPLTDLIARRSRAELCTRCRQYGVHRYCGVYARAGEFMGSPT